MRHCLGLLRLALDGFSRRRVDAQVIPPLPVGGTRAACAAAAVPADPARASSPAVIAPIAAAAAPDTASELWVPDRQVFAPGLGRVVTVPGHYERRISDQQFAVPTLPVYDGTNGAQIIVPGSDRPPVDVRQGP